MTDNEIITAWLGKEIDPLDPAAWTPELFDAIERAGLKKPFIGWLGEHADLHNAKTFEDFRDTIDEYVWLIAKSPPEQKARALAKAIMEVER